jgi:hypothetical protein
MLNLPFFAGDSRSTSIDVDEVVHFSTGEPDREGQPRQRRTGAARHAKGAARARWLRAIPIEELIAASAVPASCT